MENKEDFDNFLKNVDEISKMVKDMSSADTSSQVKAMERADSWLGAAKLTDSKQQKGAINRTVINTAPSATVTAPLTSASAPGLSGDPGASQEAFMRMLEKDAEERRKRRKEREEKAKDLKARGNAAFTQGDYESAVLLYTQGLEELKDMQELYTNRAQALIKLERYNDAISDCEWALKCNERSVKAYVHMGRAQLGLRDYAKARECYEKILEIAPEREAMVKDYLSQVERTERREREEQRAREDCQKAEDEEEEKENKEEEENKASMMMMMMTGGSSSSSRETQVGRLLQLLRKLDTPHQMSLYYCGGLELLTHAIADCTGQTIFRLQNGFGIIHGNSTILSCLLQKSEDPCAEELCLAVLKLWSTVCRGNETNQQLLMEWERMQECVMCLLASTSEVVRYECVSLLIAYTHTKEGSGLLVDKLDMHMLVEPLRRCMDVRGLDTRVLNLLESLAQEHRFRHQIREGLSPILSPFTHRLRNVNGQHKSTLSLYTSVIGHLVYDSGIRKSVASSQECWEAFLVAMDSISCEDRDDLLYPLLGLMINLATEHTPAIQGCAVVCSSRCCALLSDPSGGIITRAVGLLSRLLPQCPAAVEEAVVRGGAVKKLLRILKSPGQESTRYAMRTLAKCTESSVEARQQLSNLDKKLQVLIGLVGEGEEHVAGNAALCLGHCVCEPGVARALLDTDCVLTLLRHAAADDNADALQRNAAIALAKLCQAEPRHMTRLRELHGLEILHACMKLIS
ncbi:tetratricopeptide repeat protein 12 [Engraulis encrasicolus]|uniref:tetratricopeptide repeat protein 12 n=1 Tax=Engraulis encrasicolus TaxID=184585 RepID=UPI002FD38C85